MRNAMWHYQHAGMDDFVNIRHDTWHLNQRGHQYVAELACHFFMQALNLKRLQLEDITKFPSIWQPEKMASMLPALDTVPTTLHCAFSDTLHSSSQLVIRGNNWTFSADDKRKLKWGMITYQPGSVLQIIWQQPGIVTNATMFIGFERSFNPEMTNAQVECHSGCKCFSHVLQGHSEHHVTVMEHQPIDIALLADKCVVSIKAILREGKPKLRFKIGAIIISVNETARSFMAAGLAPKV